MPVSIGPIIKVDGEAEYRKSMAQIIATTKDLNAELKAQATSFDKSGKAQNTNAQKVENLKKKIEVQKKAIAEANEMCEKAKKAYGEDSIEAHTYSQKVNILTAELNQMNNELKEAGIVSKTGGFLGMGRKQGTVADMNTEIFTEIDRTKVTTISINKKKAVVISQHPDNSYELVADEDNEAVVAYLRILNPTQFWKYTDYLVISTK